jgi:pyrroline-5-carboxylate reductase
MIPWFLGLLLLSSKVFALQARPNNNNNNNNNMAARSSLSQTSLEALAEADSCRLGFLGCGTIASAIATGLATQTRVKVEAIAVSQRSATKSAALAAQFPALVSVHTDNQAVLEAADVIFITVLPQQANEVLAGLQFDPSRHVLVSLVSTSKLPDLALASGLPAESVLKMICLPSVADHEGVCLVTPPTEHPTLLALFESLGGVVQAKDEEQMSALMVPTGLMGSFYGLLKNNRDFLVSQGGLDPAQASFLVARLYRSMIRDAEARCMEPDAYEALIAEQTPGGLNEQGLENLTQLGGLEAYDKMQAAIHSRILGKSDGSLE